VRRVPVPQAGTRRYIAAQLLLGDPDGGDLLPVAVTIQDAHDRIHPHRPEGTIRIVSMPPVLVRMLRRHLHQFGTAPDGRLFRGTPGGMLSESVYGRAWHAARHAALGPELAATALARRPYDLRHAALSLWLNASGAPAEVAARAGNSARVLHDVYLHCIDSHDDPVSQRIEDALDTGRSGSYPSRCVTASGYTHRRLRPGPCPLSVREPRQSPRLPDMPSSHHQIHLPALAGVSAVQTALCGSVSGGCEPPDPAHT
jgi:hypothetical protein